MPQTNSYLIGWPGGTGDSVFEVGADEGDLAELERVLGHSEKLISGVLRNSLNRGGSRMRTVSTKIVSKEVGLQSKIVRLKMRLRRATARNLDAKLYLAGRGFGAIRFGAQQNDVGVVIRMKRRQTLGHAFIATMPSGHTGVFRRSGRKRLPIDEQYVEGPGAVVRRVAKTGYVLDEGAAAFRKRIPHELDRVLKRHAARGEALVGAR